MNDSANTQALWPQMISALAAIDRELGLPDDGCNSLHQTLSAIRELKDDSNLKKRTRQLSTAARAIQTRKRDMLTELYYSRALLMMVRDDSNAASALKRIDSAIKIGEM